MSVLCNLYSISVNMNENEDKSDVTSPLTIQINHSKIVIDDKEKKNLTKFDVKKYKRRWFILGLFCFYCGLSTFQWVEYSIITNIITR